MQAGKAKTEANRRHFAQNPVVFMPSPLPLVHAKQPVHAPCCCFIPAGPTGYSDKEYRPLTVGLEESLQNTGFDDDYYDGDDITHPIRQAGAESSGKCADNLI